MKTILTLLVAIPFVAISQDRIITTSIDTLNVKVIKSSSNEVEYVYPNEDAVNVLPKSKIFKIEYASGRVEVVRVVNDDVSEVKKKPKNKVVPRFRWGFRAGANLPRINGLDNGSTNRVGVMGGVSTELKFLNTKNSIIIDAYVNQMYARSPSRTDNIEVVYVSLPIVYGADITNRFRFIIGIEPSFTAYSDYYQSGNYYDATSVTNDAVFGVTGGGRLQIFPRSLYLDFRGVVGTSNMFTFADNSPHKINLSLGYYIKY